MNTGNRVSGRSHDILVNLRLEGDFKHHGFWAAVEISSDSAGPVVGVSRYLPPIPAISQTLHQWRDQHRLLGTRTRIQPQAIVYEGSFQSRLQDYRRAAQDLSQCLTQWLTSSEFLALDKQLRSHLSTEASVRVCIRSSNRQVQRLPWHLWDITDDYPHVEIVINPTNYGSLPLPQLLAHPTHRQIKVLAIIGLAEGIDVSADRQELEKLSDADVQLLEAPNRQQVTTALRSQPWDILFFAGHSRTDGSSGYIDLNPHDSLSLKDLKYSLRQAINQGLQLAIFNSCDGLGLAWQLEELSIPQMIVMREPVPDAVAQSFLKAFLRSFAAGKSLYQAIREAREELQGLEDTFPCASWLPILYQHPAAIAPTWQRLKQPPKPPIEWVTLVFTDLVNSTQVKNYLPGSDVNSRNQCYVDTILNPHRQRIFNDLELYGGQLIKTEGDGNFLSFEDTIQAARWAKALQLDHLRNPIGTPLGSLQVRIGIHTGTPLPDATDRQDFVGQQVDYAARLANLAQGGQILLSDLAAALVQSADFDDMPVHSHGSFRLKGLGRVQIWELLYSKKPIQQPRPVDTSPPRWAIALVASLVVTLLVTAVRLLGWLQPLELKAYDQLMRWRPEEGMDPRLLVVQATEADVNRYGFPLPDGVLAEIIEELNRHEPRLIGLDIFRDRPVPPGHEVLLGQLQQQSHVISLCSVGERDNPNFPGVRPPGGIPENRLGFSDVWPDPDGVLRRQVMFMHSDYQEACSTAFSFGALVALDYLEQQSITAKTLSHNQIQIGGKRFNRLQAFAGGYQQLDNRGFQVLLNYRQTSQVAQSVSVSELLEGQAKPEWISNRVVLVGVTAPISNATDYFWTPLSAAQWPYQEIPGVMLQAQMVSQILSAVLDTRVLIQPLPVGVDILWMGIWGLFGSLTAAYFTQGWPKVGGIVVVSGLLYSAGFILLLNGWWIPIVPSFLSILGSMGVVSGYSRCQLYLGSRSKGLKARVDLG